MRNRILLAGMLLFLGSGMMFSREKPNVLFIMTDQQTYDMMSCSGNPWLKTPNMDRIAGMGYRFDRTYCVNPVCMPSRFSLLTGHYASEVGVKENTSAYDPGKVEEIIRTDALGVIFRNAGYETLYSGKVHLYGTKLTTEYGFENHGTDPYEGAANYGETALREMGKTRRDKPFFLFLSFLNPHDICYKAGIDDRFPDKLSEENARETARLLALQASLDPKEYQSQVPPRVKNTVPISTELPEMVEMSSQSREWTDDQWDLYTWMYLRLTESVDNLIGRVLTALEQSGMQDNTIIVFTSDHGDMHGAHGLILKNVEFEEAQRVPLIFAGKGIKKNVVDTSTLVCNGLDFIPTICDLAGIEYPANLPGVSLKSYLTGVGQKPDRKYIITEGYNAYQVTDGRYKLTLYELPGHPRLLTDLLADPGETISYLDDPGYAEIRDELTETLMADLKRRGIDPVPVDRTIRNLRARENELLLQKSKKAKSETE